MLKKGTKISICGKKVKMQIGKYAAVAVICCGLTGTGQFLLCAEAAQAEEAQTAVEAQEGGNPEIPEALEQGAVMEAEKRTEMKAAPEDTAETLMVFQAGDLIFAVGEPEDGWYRVIYQGNEGYVKEKGLDALEIDIEGLNAEMAANEAETEFVVEAVEKYRADARRSKIWGTVIIVLVASIFGVGIFSAVKGNKNGDAEKSGERNGEKRSDKGGRGSFRKNRKRKEPGQIKIEDLN